MLPSERPRTGGSHVFHAALRLPWSMAHMAGILSLVAAPCASDAHHPLADRLFAQEYREDFPLSSQSENDVRGIAAGPGGRVWAATAAGVRIRKDGKWSAPQGADAAGPALCIRTAADGRVWAGTVNGLYECDHDSLRPAAAAGLPISCIGTGAVVVAGGPDGVWRFDRNYWQPVAGNWQKTLRALLPDSDGALWVATAAGLYHAAPGRSVTLLNHPRDILSSSLYSLARDHRDRIWAGSSGGIDVYANGRRVTSFSGRTTLPNPHARSISFDSLGRAWVATRLGVARRDGRRWALRHSRRWLLSDDVRDLSIAPDGAVWCATASGVSVIRTRRWTLENKAAYYLDIVRRYNIREPGIVSIAKSKEEGRIVNSYVADTDNDGSLTACWLATECYRYSVTRAPDALANARRAFQAIEFLQTVTGTDYFIARTAVPISQLPENDLNRKYTPAEIAEERVRNSRFKKVEDRWRKSADGRWLWKGDTSSDEIDGHLYGLATFYQLAANPAEKERVRKLVDRIVGGVVRNGFYLVDTDGSPTLWGVWAPERLNGDPDWRGERAINSLEILAYLRAAEAVTGKKAYAEAARSLIERHDYLENARHTEYDVPSERTAIDDDLLSMVWPVLFETEKDPARLTVYRESLRTWYRGVARQHAPVFDFLYRRYSGRSIALDRAVQHLRDWPIDPFQWNIDNSRRADVPLDATPGLEEQTLSRLVPMDERGQNEFEFDKDPFAAVRWGDGKRFYGALAWLKCYWMARHYGCLASPSPADPPHIHRPLPH